MAKTEGKRVSKRVAIYLRVSTTEQTTTNQRRELHAVAKRHGPGRLVAFFHGHLMTGRASGWCNRRAYGEVPDQYASLFRSARR